MPEYELTLKLKVRATDSADARAAGNLLIEWAEMDLDRYPRHGLQRWAEFDPDFTVERIGS